MVLPIIMRCHETNTPCFGLKKSTTTGKRRTGCGGVSDERTHGRSTYLKYKCRCTICVEDAREYRAKIRKPVLILDGETLIKRLSVDGRLAAVNTKTTHRWRSEGLSIYSADKWAIRLGYHPYEIWGADFYRGCNE